MNIAPETSGLPISLSTIHEDLDSLAIDKFKPTIRDLIMNGLPNGLKQLQCAKCELNDVRTKVLVNRLKCLSQIQVGMNSTICFYFRVCTIMFLPSTW